MEESKEKKVVFVTGASGFIAGHVIEDLMKNGYFVRASARNPTDTKLNFLRDLAKKYPTGDGESRLELVAADLTVENAFDSLVKGCWGVAHVASPTFQGSEGRTNPEKAYIEPAVKGTLGVLQACQKAGVKRIVITSSVAMLAPDPNVHGRRAANEQDSNTVATLTTSPYPYSKIQADQAMHKFLDALSAEERPRVATIHPSMVWGPQQNETVTSSNQIIRALFTGEYPLTPPLVFVPVDVRDVARAHTLCLQDERANGRYVVSNPGWASMLTYAQFLKAKYPAAPVPTWRMPIWLMRVISWFDTRIDSETIEWGCSRRAYDGSKIERELGFKYEYGYDLKDRLTEYDPKQMPDGLQRTMCDTVDSFIKFGIGKKPAEKAKK